MLSLEVTLPVVLAGELLAARWMSAFEEPAFAVNSSFVSAKILFQSESFGILAGETLERPLVCLDVFPIISISTLTFYIGMDHT